MEPNHNVFQVGVLKVSREQKPLNDEILNVLDIFWLGGGFGGSVKFYGVVGY